MLSHAKAATNMGTNSIPKVRETAHAINNAVKQSNSARLSRTMKAGTRLMSSYPFPKIPRPKRNALYYNTFYYGSQLKNGIRDRLPPIRGFSQTYQRLNGSSISGQDPRAHHQLIKYLVIVSIGFICYGMTARMYHLSKGKGDEEDEADEDEHAGPSTSIVKPSHSWTFFCYSTLPLNAISRLWGRINSIDLPVWLRAPGYKFYAYCFGVNLDEMKDPELDHYKNLSEFFYRELKDGARAIAKDADLVCPSDGLVLQFGAIDNGEIEQVKGMTYSIDAFLGNATTSKLAAPAHEVCFNHPDEEEVHKRHEEFAKINGISYTLDDIIGGEGKNVTHLKKIYYKEEGDRTVEKAGSAKIAEVASNVTNSTPTKDSDKELFFAVIYLAPGDYHRYHSPTNWVVQLRRHFVGELYSVAPYFQKTLQNLFVLNERVSLLGYWKHGFFSMTPVGATNVGSIKVNFDKDLTTNTKYQSPHYSDSDDELVRVKKHTCYEATYSNASKVLGGFPVTTGEEVGGFMLGSTVVLVFEAPKEFRFDIKKGEKVKMGQSLGRIH